MKNQEQIFFSQLESIENNLHFIVCSFKDISFVNLNTIKIQGKNYIFSNCAFLSLNNQIKIKGLGTHDLSPTLKIQMYNEVLRGSRLGSKQACILLINNQVKNISLYTSDKRSFNYIRFSDLLAIFTFYLKDNNYIFSFNNGIIDDYISSVRYNIKNFSFSKYQLCVDIISSYSSYSSIKICPILVYKNNEIKLTEQLCFEHKGNPLNRIKDKLSLLFEQVDTTINTLELNANKLSEQSIQQLCKRVGTTKKLEKYIIRHIQGNSFNDLLEVLFSIDFAGPHGEPRADMIGKFINGAQTK